MLNQAGNDYKYEYSFTVLGDAYKAWGEIQKAEEQHQLAASMVPHEFYPLFLLAKWYNETGHHIKSVALTQQILTKEIKVPSQAIEEIKEEIREVKQSSTISLEETQIRITKGKNYAKNCTTGIEQQFW
jgi:O-antigen polymerase